MTIVIENWNVRVSGLEMLVYSYLKYKLGRQEVVQGIAMNHERLKSIAAMEQVELDVGHC